MQTKYAADAELDPGEPTDEELAAALYVAWCDDATAWRRLDKRDRVRWLEIARVARAALAMPQPPILPLHSRREQQVYRGGWIAGFQARVRDARAA